jgi:hypothetical protein
MQYKVNMNNWQVDIDLESDDFDLIVELQGAIQSTLDFYEAEPKDEENEQEEFDFGDESEDSQGTIIIINNK